jgi:uncharacterized membrane protein YidH (DUF202 family)
VIPKAEVQTDSRLAARCAAIASAGAGLIHFAVMPAHWLDWIPSGLFFAAVAVFQLMWAFLAWTRPRALLLALGIVANAGSAALWVVSRTVGLPFGPQVGVPEAVEGAGICVLLLECYVIMGAAWAWLQDYEPEAVSRFRSALVMIGANGVIAGTVCVGVASGFQGHHHDGPMEAQREPRTEAAHQHDQAPHHRSEPAAVPNSPPSTPPDGAGPDGAGLPVTDMGLHVPAQERSDAGINSGASEANHGDHPHE